MIKNLTCLELKFGERCYKFLCDITAPLGEVHDVISQMKGYVISKINEAHAAQQSTECKKEECCDCTNEEKCP